MSSGNHSPEPAKESSKCSEPICKVTDSSENSESSVRPNLQETKQTFIGFNTKQSDIIASDNESYCSKCGGIKGGSETDLKTLQEAELICKCGSDMDETHEDKTNSESDAKVFETEKTKSENQTLVELGESSIDTHPAQDRDYSNNFQGISNNSTSVPTSENFTVKTGTGPKHLSSIESEQRMNGSKLTVVKAEDNSPGTDGAVGDIVQMSEGTDGAVGDIIQMNEGTAGRRSPDISCASSTRELMSRYPPHIRCREDSYSSETNRSWLNENLTLLLLLTAILFPLLIFISILLAYQFWQNNRNNRN